MHYSCVCPYVCVLSDKLEGDLRSSSECQVPMMLYHVTYVNAAPTPMKSCIDYGRH